MLKSKSQRMQPVNQLADKQDKEYASVYSQCLSIIQELKDQQEKLYSA